MGERGDLANLLRMLVRLPDTLILRGQALGFLTRPVSSVTRLAWLASQSALKLAPPRYIGHDSVPPPLASRPPMDLAAWERELDDMKLPVRQRGSIAPLIDGEAFFTELVQALQDAHQSVSVRLFIFDNDDYALRIADLLKRRSHEIRVRVLIDALGTLGAGQGARRVPRREGTPLRSPATCVPDRRSRSGRRRTHGSWPTTRRPSWWIAASRTSVA